MTHLSIIPGIGKAALELLEAAGFHDVESLAKAGENELVLELERANRILQIAKRAPAPANVGKWISTAREMTGFHLDQQTKVVMPVNYEQVREVIAMMEVAPFAIPLPAKLLMGKGLAVADIPSAILLNRYSGDLEVRVEEKIPKAPEVRTSVPANEFVKMADTSTPRAFIDHSRIKPIEAMSEGVVKPLSSRPQQDNDRVALIRGPRVETNAGRDPESRWFIRGVLHSNPFSLATGAIASILLAIILPLAVISAGLLLLTDLKPTHFEWVPRWLLAFPIALPVFGLIYLFWGFAGSCRVCGQKLFVPRMCLKNSKAHHIKLIGYIIPLSFHLLVFKWFRCTYCGTPIRLKK